MMLIFLHYSSSWDLVNDFCLKSFHYFDFPSPVSLCQGIVLFTLNISNLKRLNSKTVQISL